jgi:hypothetical protein
VRIVIQIRTDFSRPAFSHREKYKRQNAKKKRVQQGKFFPCFCEATSHRPAKKARMNMLFFVLYAAEPALIDIDS